MDGGWAHYRLRCVPTCTSIKCAKKWRMVGVRIDVYNYFTLIDLLDLSNCLHLSLQGYKDGSNCEYMYLR